MKPIKYVAIAYLFSAISIQAMDNNNNNQINATIQSPEGDCKQQEKDLIDTKCKEFTTYLDHSLHNKITECLDTTRGTFPNNTQGWFIKRVVFECIEVNANTRRTDDTTLYSTEQAISPYIFPSINNLMNGKLKEKLINILSNYPSKPYYITIRSLNNDEKNALRALSSYSEEYNANYVAALIQKVLKGNTELLPPDITAKIKEKINTKNTDTYARWGLDKWYTDHHNLKYNTNSCDRYISPYNWKENKKYVVTLTDEEISVFANSAK